MSRIFHKIFPLFDYVYILQLMEYELLRFLRWFIANPFERNLQRKNRLHLTPKALLIIFISLFEITLFSVLISLFFAKDFNFLMLALSVILLQLISPIFISIALVLILPIQNYFEHKIIMEAKIKLSEIRNIKIIAIAGSYGKTSTKNILYTLLWKNFRVVKTLKSFNTPISIARTVLDYVKSNTQVFIVEMDTYKEGDLIKIVEFVNPTIGIITAIGLQHLERFGNMDKLAKAQLELTEGIKGGIILLNSDDGFTAKSLNGIKLKNDILYFGKTSKASYFATSIRQKEKELKFDLNHNGRRIDIALPLFGEHHVSNFLAAASVANILGLSLKRIQERARLVFPTEHRLEVRRLNGITFIDNTYNTNPSVSEFSLKLLKDYKGSKKILITPGYVELGKESENENIKFMDKASKIVDEIIIVGQNSRDILLKGLGTAKFPKQRIHLVKDTKSALDTLFSLGKTSDVALFENDLPDQYF